MDHDALHELAAGAAIEDLDPAEWQAFRAHAVSCVGCARLARELDDVMADLALAAPGRTPPATLRTSILTAIRADAAAASADTAVRDDGPAPGRTDPGLPPLRLVADPRRPAAGSPVAPVADAVVGPLPAGSDAAASAGRWRLGTMAAVAVAAVFAVVAVGLAVETTRLSADVAAVRSQLDAQLAAMAVLVDPAHQTATLQAEPLAPNASAVAVWRPGTTESYLMAEGLPPTPAGTVYQLWWADEAGVHALGTYTYAGDGPFLAPFGVDLSTGAAAMLTLEPEGGASGGEPGPQVVFGEL